MPAAHVPAAFTDSGRAARVAAVLPEIDKMYAALAAEKHLPGLVYGVVMDGKLVHVRALGHANIERKAAASAATAFRIASMTKSFAAMAALHLRDAGKLRLDDPVADFLPELRGVRLPTADSPVLTVRHLLTMSTGLPEDNPWGDRQMAVDNAALAKLVAAGLSFSNAPGIGYRVQQPWLHHARARSSARCRACASRITSPQNILLPLGMKDTVWEYEGHRRATGLRRATGGSATAGWPNRCCMTATAPRWAA